VYTLYSSDIKGYKGGGGGGHKPFINKPRINLHLTILSLHLIYFFAK